MTRRDLFYLACPAALLGQEPATGPDLAPRIAQIIHAYEAQGIHRTATTVDQVSGEWLETEVRQCGCVPAREVFPISRIDLVTASLHAEGRFIEGIPLFDGGFTGPDGVTGRLGPVASDAPIALTEAAPNTAGAGPTGEARRQNRHKAIIIVTRGGRPGLCPSNAERFLQPFGPPALQVSREEAASLAALARRGSSVTVIAHVKRTPAEAFNVTASIPGTTPALPPLVIMTPRSGWWTCASERGGGLACWLELMRGLRASKPAREILFVASSGHELGQRGIEVYSERRPDLIKRAHAWIHLGANIGAAQQPGNIIQASSDEMETTLANGLTAAGLTINRRVPRGTVPAGEAGVVHRGGGRYMSLLGASALFHNPADRGPAAVDTNVIARFVAALIPIARSLAD